MLFLQGTRDALADLSLLRPIVAALPQATLHVVDGADHSFQVLKKSGRTGVQVLAELAGTLAAWVRRVLQQSCSKANTSAPPVPAPPSSPPG